MSASVVVVGADGATRELDGTQLRLLQLRPGLQQVAGVIFTEQREWWATRGRGSWQPREQSTERRHPFGSLMDLSGDLEQAATVQGAEEQYLKIGGSSIALGVDGDLYYVNPLAEHGRSAYADPDTDPAYADRTADALAAYLVQR